jgi:crotonobetainyl-CoA:carnitine CoA-transferase CaiB-like acyl-CoA transferase
MSVRTDSETLPLSGVTVVDLTQVIAGPFGTMNLGDLGAEVIKIEAVGRGDRSRNIHPIPAYFDTINRNKRSIEVNLKREEGQRIVRELVRDADVFVESTKPGRVESFNLSYEDLREINPSIIYCSISGFGSDSPYENLPAWDTLIQAMSGIMSITGEEGGQPLWSGLPSGDLITSMYTTQSVLAALYARERGVIDSEWIEIPMLDAAISWLCARAGHTFGLDEPFPRLGTRHPTIAPFGLFSCRDENIVIAAGTGSLWEEFCTVLDRKDLLEDERFKTMHDRSQNAEALTEIIEAELAADAADAWVDRLQAADIPAGPIHDTKSIWEDEHVVRRNLRRTMERDGREDADVIDHPVHFSSLNTHLGTPPEELGESTTNLLAQQGYDEAEIERLREAGVVGE